MCRFNYLLVAFVLRTTMSEQSLKLQGRCVSQFFSGDWGILSVFDLCLAFNLGLFRLCSGFIGIIAANVDLNRFNRSILAEAETKLEQALKRSKEVGRVLDKETGVEETHVIEEGCVLADLKVDLFAGSL